MHYISTANDYNTFNNTNFSLYSYQIYHLYFISSPQNYMEKFREKY